MKLWFWKYFPQLIVGYCLFVLLCPAGLAQERPPEWLPPEEFPQEPVTPEAREIHFEDVPEKHWARDAVYELVKLGATQGYPDGTYKGKRNVVRYEMAAFLIKFEKGLYFRLGEAALEEQKKLEQELEEAQKLLEEKKKPLKQELKPEFGKIITRVRIGDLTLLGAENSSEPVGPRFDYRLKASLKRKFNDSVSVAVNIDTMDMGWGGGNEEIATKLFDLEGSFKYDLGWGNPIIIKATVGPGTQIHSEGGTAKFISEDGIAYLRPYNSLGFSTKFGGFDFSSVYKIISITSSGEAEIHSISATLSTGFENLYLKKLSGTIDYLFKDQSIDPPGPHDFRGEIDALFLLGKFEFLGILGIANVEEHDGSYVGFGVKYDDLKQSGFSFESKIHKLGTRCINYPEPLGEDDYYGVNFFDKLLIPGYVDIGGALIQRISKQIDLRGKVDAILTGEGKYGEEYPGTNSTFEIELLYNTETYSSVGFTYLLYHDPSSSGNTVSDIVGLKASLEF